MRIKSKLSLTHLLIENTIFLTADKSAVLLQYRAKVPPLKLAEASYHCSRTMSTKIAHHKYRVRSRLDEEMQRLQYYLFRNRVPCIRRIEHAKMVELNLLIDAKVEKARLGFFGREPNDALQTKLLEERKVELIRLA